MNRATNRAREGRMWARPDRPRRPQPATIICALRPVILIPGVGGSILVEKGHEHRKLFNQSVPDNRWVSIYSFTKQEMARWKKDMHFSLHMEEGRVAGVKPDVQLEPYDFGGTRGIKDIVPEFLLFPPQYQKPIEDLFHHRYFHAICSSLQRHGYKERVNLFGAPYDFRLVLDPFVRAHFFQQLKDLIVRATASNGEKAVVVSHSLGGIMFKWFASSYVSQEWVDTHIERWVSLSAPFGGSYQALRAVTCGDHYIPAMRPMVQHELQRNLGIIACLPNQLAFDAHEPVWYLGGRPVYVDDFNTLGHRDHIVPFRLWSDLFLPHLERDISRRVRIPTDAVFAKDKGRTQGVSFADAWNKVPSREIRVVGDGVVPFQSLRSIERVLVPRHLHETIVYDHDHTTLMTCDQVMKIILRHGNGHR